MIPPAPVVRYGSHPDQVRTCISRRPRGPVELVVIAGAGHFDAIDPAHEAWRTVVERLPRLFGTA